MKRAVIFHVTNKQDMILIAKAFFCNKRKYILLLLKKIIYKIDLKTLKKEEVNG